MRRRGTAVPLARGFKSLRWQLILRTLLPLSLLVGTFAVAGQVGYTQVTEALARDRGTEIAKIEAARVGDFLLDAVRAIDQVAGSPDIYDPRPTVVYNVLRSESLSRSFDFVQVINAEGNAVATSEAKVEGKPLNAAGFDFLKGPTPLRMVFRRGKLLDGRDAIILSLRYYNSNGGFGGVVEGAIAFGSAKLSHPLRESTDSGSNLASTGSGVSYIAALDGTVLWHPNAQNVGGPARIGGQSAFATDKPEAIITSVEGTRYIIAYAPLNLGLLLAQGDVEPQWLRWYVVTEHKWSDVVAPVNSVLSWLAVLALGLFVLALSLVARSARALTTPVASLVNAAQTLSAGKLKDQLNILDIGGPLEIEELARHFNFMAEQLRASYADLEQKVTDRTQELAGANSELARRLRETQTMHLVASKFAGTAGLDEILDVIASSATEALEAEGSVVFLPSDRYPDDLEAAVVHNIKGIKIGTRVGKDGSLSGLTFRSGEPHTSAITQEDERVDRNFAAATSATSMLSAPLVSRGQVIGVINTLNKKWGEFTDEDVRLLTLLANQAAVAVERARLYSEARKQVETLETLNELSLSITVSKSIEETLVGGMEHIGKLLGARGAAVFLLNERNRMLEYTAGYNIDPSHRQVIVGRPMPVDSPHDSHIAALDAFRTQQPHWVNDMHDESYMREWADFVEATGVGSVQDARRVYGVRSLVALPLSVRDKRLGSITLYFKEARSFKATEVRLFESFANILALAVYNTQLVAQSNKLATVEERARLARELHDSVTQSLFSLNLTLRAARRNMQLSPTQAEGLLDNVQELAQGALAEMRALIFELRPQALANEGLISALEKHSDSVRARSGLQVYLDVTGDRRLRLEVEEALYQIAREALHNVVKHAHARAAWVCLDLEGPGVSLSIRDDGRGFDPSAIASNGGSHIGTSTMRERAEAIGGTLALTSSPGNGTEVLVTVSVAASEVVPLPQASVSPEPAAQAVNG